MRQVAVDEASSYVKGISKERQLCRYIIPVHHDVDNNIKGPSRHCPDPQTTKFISLFMVTLSQEMILG